MRRRLHLSIDLVLLLSVFIGPVCIELVGDSSARAQGLLDPTTLTKYIDPLPNPLNNTLSPVGTMDGAPYYEVAMSQFNQQLHSQLAPTTVWGYNGAYPGPTFDVQRNQPVKVKWINNLVDGTGQPLQHLLPYDNTLHGSESHFPEVRTVAHLHGGVVEPQSDGFPEYWFTADPNAPANGLGGPAGNSDTYTYHNAQPSATLWYHDHGMGTTRLNVYAGLAGFYLVRDSQEAALNLPSGDYEVPLVIQDRSFYSDGQLFYPRGPGDLTDPGGPNPLDGLPPEFTGSASVVPHFFGNTNLVNGKVWPVLDVEPRKYRFRIVNGSNARFYDLQLDADQAGTLTFHQIGSDGGLLEARTDRGQMLMAPAERADVIVDFSTLSVGEEVILRNLGPDGPFEFPGAGHTPADPNTTGQVMKFRIVAPTGTDTSSLPQSLVSVPRILESEAVATRQLSLVEDVDEFGRPKLLLDGAKWTDPMTELPVKGTTEIWEITNSTTDSHPIHLHLVQFQVLDRVSRQLGEIPLEPHELGWKDTVKVNRRETVRVIARFEDFEGLYVWHCHILEHEDHEMMRPYEVVPGPELVVEQGVTLTLGDPHTTPAGYTLTVEGTFNAPQLTMQGLLRGTGDVQSNVVNEGTISPGVDDFGALTVTGDFTQQAGGFLQVELAGPASHDALSVTGTTSLNGTLSLNKDEAYDPTLGDEMVLLTSGGALSGPFSTVKNVAVSNQLGFAVRYLSNSVSVRVSIFGDTDFDNDVDTADLTAAIIGFTGASGSGSTWVRGDLDGDGDTDTADLTGAIINFTGASGGATNVPDLVYDPSTGRVTIDADGADVISFSLQPGPFNAADFSDLPAGLTDNIAGQIGWTSFNLFSGLTGTADLGVILPAGLDEAGLLAALQTASYGLALSGGGGGGTFEIFIPEPASAALLLIGLVGLLARGRSRIGYRVLPVPVQPGHFSKRHAELKMTILGLSLGGLIAFAAFESGATTINLAPVRDNTLVDKSDGSLSNGAGSYLFAGRIDKSSENLRRAVLAFDIAGNVPSGSVIQSVSLTLTMSRSKVRSMTFDLHRVTSDWGEGASNADGQEGVGASAEPGDATWLHTFYDGSFWTNAGGDFDATISGSTSVDRTGSYTWGSTAQMVADVQSWLDTPAGNFGWLLKGPENVRSAKRFNSRENGDAATRPRLVIDFVSGGPETFNWIGTSGGSFHDNTKWDTNQAPSSPTDLVNLVNNELTDQVVTLSNNIAIDRLTISGTSNRMTLSIGQGVVANVGNLRIRELGGLGVNLATGGSAPLNASGPAELDGILNLSTPGFTPAPTDTFEVLTYPSRTGLFDTIMGQSIDPTRAFSLHYNDSRALAIAGQWAADGEQLSGDADVNQELLVTGPWNWDGTLVKRGTGELILDMDGGFSAGLGATLAILEGTVRLRGTAQTLTLDNLTYGDLEALSGDPSFAGLHGWYGNVNVPEPMTLILISIGLLGFNARRRENRRCA